MSTPHIPDNLDAAAAAALAAAAAVAAEPIAVSAHFGRLLNKPAEYDGKDRNGCQSFLTQCRLFILGNPHLFVDDQMKVLFAATYLRGKAFAWLEPLLNKNDPICRDWDAFQAALIRNLGDADHERTMARKLKSLRQTNSAAAYRTEFENIRQYLTWDDAALRTYFYDGLKDSVKDILSHVTDEPADFKDFQELCIRIDNRLFERQQEGKSHRPANHGNAQARSAPRTQAQTSVTSTTTTTSTSRDTPMDLDSAASRKFKPLTDAEKKRRRDNNLCAYCGGEGHIAVHCPAKKNRGHRLQAVLTAPVDAPAPLNA